MPNVHALNPWGRASNAGRWTYDAQRADLWQIDLSGVVSQIRGMLTAIQGNVLSNFRGAGQASSLQNNLPVSTEALYLAQSVDLSELRVDTTTVFRDTLPYLMPGMDSVPGAIKITFLVDAGSPSPTKGSKLLSLLYAWRAMSRAGRGSFEGGFSNQPDYELAFGLADASNNGTLQPNYRYDVVINLLRGGIPAPVASANGGNVNVIPAIEVTGTLKIKQLWLTGIQPAGLQYSGAAQMWMVSASFACSGWLPINLQPQVF